MWWSKWQTQLYNDGTNDRESCLAWPFVCTVFVVVALQCSAAVKLSSTVITAVCQHFLVFIAHFFLLSQITDVVHDTISNKSEKQRNGSSAAESKCTLCVRPQFQLITGICVFHFSFLIFGNEYSSQCDQTVRQKKMVLLDSG